MTRRTRLLLTGAAVVMLALIPGSAGASTIGGSDPGHRCSDPTAGAPSENSY